MNDLVDRIAPIDGVIAIILFGSVAKGLADEYSDVDVLILFRDKKTLWKGWDSVFDAIGPMKLDIHAIPETLEEFRNANPVFFDEVNKNGIVLYSSCMKKTEYRAASNIVLKSINLLE